MTVPLFTKPLNILTADFTVVPRGTMYTRYDSVCVRKSDGQTLGEIVVEEGPRYAYNDCPKKVGRIVVDDVLYDFAGMDARCGSDDLRYAITHRLAGWAPGVEFWQQPDGSLLTVAIAAGD